MPPGTAVLPRPRGLPDTTQHILPACPSAKAGPPGAFPAKPLCPHLGKFGRKRSQPASEPPGQSGERPCPRACRGGSGPSCDAPRPAPTLSAPPPPPQLPEGRSGSGAGSRPTRGEGWASLEPQSGAPPGNAGKTSCSGAVRTGQNVYPSPRPGPACWGSHDPRRSRRGEGPTDTPPQSSWVYDRPLLGVRAPSPGPLWGQGLPWWSSPGTQLRGAIPLLACGVCGLWLQGRVGGSIQPAPCGSVRA